MGTKGSDPVEGVALLLIQMRAHDRRAALLDLHKTDKNLYIQVVQRIRELPRTVSG